MARGLRVVVSLGSVSGCFILFSQNVYLRDTDVGCLRSARVTEDRLLERRQVESRARAFG